MTTQPATETSANPFAQMVQAEWTATSTLAAWRKWHEKTVPHLAPMTEVLLEAADIMPGHCVLDIASGSGEPAFTLASRVGKEGRVTATDLSAGMLEIARENNRETSNLDFRQADAHDLPFPDAHFDTVTCRLGVMYFWDCQRALREILRVLKPGGHTVLVAWGELECNHLARTVLMPFARRRQLPDLPPSAPHPLRFALSGSLTAELENAGFCQIREEKKIIPCPWPGPPEELWDQVYAMAVPLQPFFDGFEPGERDAAIREVIEEFSRFHDGEQTDPGTCVMVVTGIK